MQKKGYAGTLESNDIYIVIEEKPAVDGIQIILESIVLAQFGHSIQQTIEQTVKEAGVDCGLEITAKDKGALSCTIEARVRTALQRAGIVGENQS